MIEFLLYFIVFLIVLTGVVALPWAGIDAIKMALWQIKNPRSPRWYDEVFDVGTTFAIGVVQIGLGFVFVFIGYQLILEMIKTF